VPANHINEIGWWQRKTWQQIGDFEQTIKDAYLKMAQDAE